MNDDKLERAINLKRQIKEVKVVCDDIDRFFEKIDEGDKPMDSFRFMNIISGAKDYLYMSDMTEYVSFIKDSMEEKLDYLMMEYKEL